jgi:hypothetical protein
MYSTDDLVQRAVQALRKMRKGIYNGVNPRAGVTIPKEKNTDESAVPTPLRKWKNTLSFSPEQNLPSSKPRAARTLPKLLRVLSRAVIGVAAFAGLREGEIRGQ